MIVPFFNRERLLAETIASILEQHYRKIQLILVNDGSSDRSLRIARSFSDTRIEVVHRRTNQGKSRSVNSVLPRARGEWVTIFDSDDLMTGRSLSDRIAFLKSHPKTIAVIGRFDRLIDNNGRLLSHRHPLAGYYLATRVLLRRMVRFFREIPPEFFIFGACIPGPMGSTLLRREAIERVGGLNSHFDPIEDLEYLARLAAVQPLPFLDLPVFQYRIHGNNLSGRLKRGSWWPSPLAMKRIALLRRNFRMKSGKEDGES